MNKHKTKFTNEQLAKFVKESYTIADVCRKCGWKPQGSNYKIIHRFINENRIDTSHFTGQRTNIGNCLNKHNEKSVYEYLKKHSCVKTSSLKKKLVDNNLKEYKCEICGITEYNGLPITLQLHHINGDNFDNRLENLMLLCPNCHSQTDNYCGKKNLKHEHKKCPICGKQLKCKDSTYCSKCASKVNGEKHRKPCPSKEELEQLIQVYSFEEIGRKYSVSGKAVTKWCKRYSLPSKRKDIKKIYQ